MVGLYFCEAWGHDDRRHQAQPRPAFAGIQSAESKVQKIVGVSLGC
jgi:hypothetical protein